MDFLLWRAIAQWMRFPRSWDLWAYKMCIHRIHYLFARTRVAFWVAVSVTYEADPNIEPVLHVKRIPTRNTMVAKVIGTERLGGGSGSINPWKDLLMLKALLLLLSHNNYSPNPPQQSYLHHFLFIFNYLAN